MATLRHRLTQPIVPLHHLPHLFTTHQSWHKSRPKDQWLPLHQQVEEGEGLGQSVISPGVVVVAMKEDKTTCLGQWPRSTLLPGSFRHHCSNSLWEVARTTNHQGEEVVEMSLCLRRPLHRRPP